MRCCLMVYLLKVLSDIAPRTLSHFLFQICPKLSQTRPRPLFMKSVTGSCSVGLGVVINRWIILLTGLTGRPLIGRLNRNCQHISSFLCIIPYSHALNYVIPKYATIWSIPSYRGARRGWKGLRGKILGFVCSQVNGSAAINRPNNWLIGLTS